MTQPRAPDAVMQIVSNALSNALEYTPPDVRGGVTIAARIARPHAL